MRPPDKEQGRPAQDGPKVSQQLAGSTIPSLQVGVTALLEPDAEQLGDQAARRLLEQAGRYVREALAFPDDIANFRTITAEVLLENAMLRLDVQRLAERVTALERRAGVGR